MAEKRIFFKADGLKLEGMLADFHNDKEVVISHPHPLYGGSMHNNVVKAVAHAYQEEEFSTLRFDFRGVERSEGDYDNGVGEQEDVKAAGDGDPIARKFLGLAGGKLRILPLLAAPRG